MTNSRVNLAEAEAVGHTLDDLDEWVNRSLHDFTDPLMKRMTCSLMLNRIRTISVMLEMQKDYADKLAEAGVRREGFHHHEEDGSSGIRWFVMDHRDRTDDELVQAVEKATQETMCSYAPCSAYDCTGRVIVDNANVKRGRKMAVVIQWRGLDI